MRLSRVERMAQAREASRRASTNQVTLGLDGLLERIVGGPILPTQREFILSPDRIAWYVGPVGCAKTSSLVTSVIVPALLYPGSKWFVGRWTWWTLEQTTLARFFECLARLGPNIVVDKITGPPMRIWLASARVDERGHPCEPSEVVFHGLDDIEKLGSTEFDGIAVDEANEITESMATTLNTRLRHKRPGQLTPDGPFFLRFASNPVRRSHWLHKKFCGESDCEPKPWGKKFKPQANENEKNLPPNYYDDIAAGMSPEMRIRFVEGECGPDPGGLPVFPEFRMPLHVADLRYRTGLKMVRGWDFGRRRPACVWAQPQPDGRVPRFLSLLGENEGLDRFIMKVQQASGIHFPGCPEFVDFVDPHGNRKVDVSDKSSLDVMREAGLSPRFRDVNLNIAFGMMSKALCTLIDGQPKAMYDRVGCNLLIEGYAGGYTWPEPLPGRPAKEKPLADGIYEHVMDADRYITVNLEWGSTTPLSGHLRALKRRAGDPYTGY